MQQRRQARGWLTAARQAPGWLAAAQAGRRAGVRSTHSVSLCRLRRGAEHRRHGGERAHVPTHSGVISMQPLLSSSGSNYNSRGRHASGADRQTQTAAHQGAGERLPRRGPRRRCDAPTPAHALCMPVNGCGEIASTDWPQVRAPCTTALPRAPRHAASAAAHARPPHRGLAPAPARCKWVQSLLQARESN